MKMQKRNSFFKINKSFLSPSFLKLYLLAKVFFIFFIIQVIILLISASFVHAEKDPLQKEEVLEVSEGPIDGKVSLPDGSIFEGTGSFAEGILSVTKGTLKGLALENAQYAAGIIMIQKGTVNGVAVESVNGVIQEGSGFSGTTNAPLAKVSEYTIQRTGAAFHFTDGKLIIKNAGLVSFDFENTKTQIVGDDVTQIDLSIHTIHSRNTVRVQKEDGEYIFSGNGGIFSVVNQNGKVSAEGHFGLQGIMSVNNKPIFQGTSSNGGINTITFASETTSEFGSENQMHLQGMWKYAGDETTDAPYKGIVGVAINGKMYPGDLSIKGTIPKSSPVQTSQTKSLSFDGSNYVMQYVPSSSLELQKGADISQVQKGVPLVLQSYDTAVQAAISSTGASLDQFKIGYVLALTDPKNAFLDSPDLFSSYAHDFLTLPQKYSFQTSPLGSVIVNAQGTIVYLLPATDTVSGKNTDTKENGDASASIQASGNGYSISPSFYVTDSTYEGSLTTNLPSYPLTEGKLKLALDGRIALDLSLPRDDLANVDVTTRIQPGISLLFPDGHVRLSTELETALLNGASDFSFNRLKTTAEVGATVFGISPHVGYAITYSPNKDLVHTLDMGAEYDLNTIGIPFGVSATYSLDLNKPQTPEGVFLGNKEGNVNIQVFYKKN